MNKSIPIFLALAMATPSAQALSIYIDGAVGYNIDQSSGFEGPDDLGRLQIGVKLENGLYFERSHESHISAGRPFNNNCEDWLDAYYIGWRLEYKLKW